MSASEPNLPWGVVRVHDGDPQPALRDGDHVLLTTHLPLAGTDRDLHEALRAPTLNALI